MTNPLQSEREALMWRLHKFLDAAAGEGFELAGVDAAELFCDLFDEGGIDALASRTPSPAPEGAAEPGNGFDEWWESLAIEVKLLAPSNLAFHTWKCARATLASVLTRAKINAWMMEAGWQNSSIRQVDLEKVEKVVRAALAAVPQAAETPSQEPSGLTDGLIEEIARQTLGFEPDDLQEMNENDLRSFAYALETALASQKGQQK